MTIINAGGPVPTPVTSGGTGLTSTIINQLLYSSSANVLAGLTTTNNGVLITSGAGVPSISSTLPSAVQTNITALGTQSQALDMNSHLINNVSNPVSAQDAVNLQTLQTYASGLNPIAGVYSASTANLTGYTYLSGVLTAPGIGVFTADGVSPPVNSRFLYKDDTTGSGAYNGIYVVTTSSAGSAAVLTRASDYNTALQIQPGDLIAVEFGTVNASSTWIQTATVATIGVSPIAFSVFFSASQYLSSMLTSASFYIGNVSNVGTAVTMSGDSTLSNAGVLTFNTVNSNVGTFQGITVNAKGLITAASNQNYLPNTLTSTNIFVGNGSNIATGVALSGDATLANTGSLTIGSNKITYAKMQQASTVTLLGNPTGGTANISEITLGTNLSFSGNVLNATGGGGSGTVTSITAGTGLTGGTITTSGTIALSSPVSLANGGTNNSLTATAGALVYSDASSLQLLAGPALANRMFLSAASGSPPSWTSFSFPSSVTNGRLLKGQGNILFTTVSYVDSYNANDIPFASSANNITALSAANSSVLITSSAGVPAWSGALTDGQLIIGSTGSTPVAATLTAGTNITITNAAGSITIAASGGGGGGTTWVDQTSSSATLSTAHGYITDNGASLVTYTLPASAALGDTYIILGKSSGGWKIAQLAGQSMNLGTGTTTTGTGGSYSSSVASDCTTVTCTTANTGFTLYPTQGNLTVV